MLCLSGFELCPRWVRLNDIGSSKQQVHSGANTLESHIILNAEFIDTDMLVQLII